MVCARLPQRVVAKHTVVTGEGIHYRVIEAVTHVQAARDIRRRDHDRIRLASARGAEIPAFFPLGVPAGFYGLGLVGFVHDGSKEIQQKGWQLYTASA